MNTDASTLTGGSRHSARVEPNLYMFLIFNFPQKMVFLSTKFLDDGGPI